MLVFFLEFQLFLYASDIFPVIGTYTPVKFPVTVYARSDIVLETLLWSENGSLVDCGDLVNDRNNETLNSIFKASLKCDSSQYNPDFQASSFKCQTTSSEFGL